MTPGVSIAWRDVNPDTGAQEFAWVDDEHDVFLVWHSPDDGRLHATGWGPHVETNDRLFDIAADMVIRLLELSGDAGSG